VEVGEFNETSDLSTFVLDFFEFFEVFPKAFFTAFFAAFLAAFFAIFRILAWLVIWCIPQHTVTVRRCPGDMQCPLRVINCGDGANSRCPLCPRKLPRQSAAGVSAQGH
jgi:hypothetical protein